MAENTKIEWCDVSKSPWEGCTKVSPGCLNCYAEARDRRHLHEKASHWGKGAPRWKSKTFAAEMRKLNRTVENERLNEMELGPSMHGRMARPKVFPSLCDWLDDEVPIEWLAEFLQVIHDTPNLDWLLLTKRPENFLGRMCEAMVHVDRNWMEGKCARSSLGEWIGGWIEGTAPQRGLATIPFNVRIGTSVEDQPRADERIPELLKIPAPVRFLSLEPLLGPVDLESIIQTVSPGYFGDCLQWHHRGAFQHEEGIEYPTIHWLIIGGESGPKARPCNVEWIFSLVKQGRDAGVPVFVKQLGKDAFWTDDYTGDDLDFHFTDPKGGDPSEWPWDLRVREFPRIS